MGQMADGIPRAATERVIPMLIPRVIHQSFPSAFPEVGVYRISF